MALRVHDLARELKISSAALMKHLKDMSIEVKSHMKYLEDDVSEKVRQKFRHELEQRKKYETERKLIQEQLRNKEKKDKEIKDQKIDNPFKDVKIPHAEETVQSPFKEETDSAAPQKSTNDVSTFENEEPVLQTKQDNETDKESEPKSETHPHISHTKEHRKEAKPEIREYVQGKIDYREQRRDRRVDDHRQPRNNDQRSPQSDGLRHPRNDRRTPVQQDDRRYQSRNTDPKSNRTDERQYPPRNEERRYPSKNEDRRTVGNQEDRRQGNRTDDRNTNRHDSYRPSSTNEDRRNVPRTDDRRSSQRPDFHRRDGSIQTGGHDRDQRQERPYRSDERRTTGEQQRQDNTTNNVNRPMRPRTDGQQPRRTPVTPTDKFTPRPSFPKAGIVKPENKEFQDKQFGKDKVSTVELGDKSKHLQAKLKNTKRKKKDEVLPEIDEAALEKSIKQTLSTSKKRRKHKKDDKKSNFDDIHEISISEFTSVSELAKIIDVSPSDIITKFFQMGKMVSINQRLDKDSIELICAEYELEIHFQDEFGTDIIQDKIDDMNDVVEMPRPPVVTIMGHVDHGKTSILDRIRNTKIAHGESGGITQHIGAYQAVHNDHKITFIDTPGHEAFTAMRARGANVTDVAVIVVAANDGVKPQTIEAIDHARAAGVSMIIAINKIDLPDSNIDKTIASILEQKVYLEGFGGMIPYVKCSAIRGDGIDELLEIILLSAEIKELKARFNGPGKGIVLESEKNAKMGSKATILLQQGILTKGDNIVVGSCFGNVRKMENERTLELTNIYPADIAVVYGLNNVPKAGDILSVVDSEKMARQIGGERLLIRQEREKYQSKTNLGNLFSKIKHNEMTDLRLIIKADVDGSMEAVCDSLQKLSTDEIRISIIRKSVGGIIEADVNLASASDAIIIGFNVRANNKAKKLAEDTGVEIKHYHIIFEAIDDIKKAMVGMLSPEFREKILGQALVKQVFKIKKIGTIAGCSVEKGLIQSKSKVRLYREDKIVYTGELANLKHYQDEVKEAVAGTECGITIKNYTDIKENDIIECYVLEEIERHL